MVGGINMKEVSWSVEVAGAAQIAVLDDGGGFGGGPGRRRGLPGGDGGDSAVGERADLEGARKRLRPEPA